ncbi:MAG TPA: NAD(P)-binding domain-containing protein [Thermoanaerobaculia bacterium]|nr:NAD(P)-binding domain-containing protein [Thermoanaerobaculia bacterium]
MRGTLDVVIVGAGPAGLSAALEARTAGLSYVALEKEETLGGSLLHYPRRKMVLLQPVEIATSMVLKNEEYSKERLLEIFESLVATHTLDVRFDEAVMSIERDGAAFVIRTARETYRAANVILALGRRGTPRRLNIPGEELPKVMYRLMDAESYRDQRVMIVGGGDSAIEAAVGLSLQPGNVVSLSYRREKLVRIKKKNEDAFAKAVAAGRIIPLFNTQPVSIDERTVTLKRDDGETLRIENDYVFVFAGGVPPFDFLKKIGVKMGRSASVSS